MGRKKKSGDTTRDSDAPWFDDPYDNTIPWGAPITSVKEIADEIDKAPPYSYFKDKLKDLKPKFKRHRRKKHELDDLLKDPLTELRKVKEFLGDKKSTCQPESSIEVLENENEKNNNGTNEGSVRDIVGSNYRSTSVQDTFTSMNSEEGNHMTMENSDNHINTTANNHNISNNIRGKDMFGINTMASHQLQEGMSDKAGENIKVKVKYSDALMTGSKQLDKLLQSTASSEEDSSSIKYKSSIGGLKSTYKITSLNNNPNYNSEIKEYNVRKKEKKKKKKASLSKINKELKEMKAQLELLTKSLALKVQSDQIDTKNIENEKNDNNDGNTDKPLTGQSKTSHSKLSHRYTDNLKTEGKVENQSPIEDSLQGRRNKANSNPHAESLPLTSDSSVASKVHYTSINENPPSEIVLIDNTGPKLAKPHSKVQKENVKSNLESESKNKNIKAIKRKKRKEKERREMKQFFEELDKDDKHSKGHDHINTLGATMPRRGTYSFADSNSMYGVAPIPLDQEFLEDPSHSVERLNEKYISNFTNSTLKPGDGFVLTPGSHG